LKGVERKKGLKQSSSMDPRTTGKYASLTSGNELVQREGGMRKIIGLGISERKGFSAFHLGT